MPLPPSRRDITGPPPRDVSDLGPLVRHHESWMHSLGPGYTGGRWSTPSPVPFGPSQIVGEDAGGDGEDILFWDTDEATATADGSITLHLTFEPLENSLLIWWDGDRQLPSEWTLDGQTVTFVNDHIHVGDNLSAFYAYIEAEDDAPDPGAWYRLNELIGDPTMADSSGNGHHGTYVAVGLEVPGLLAGSSDTAGYCNGVTSHAMVSYDAWMNTPEVSATILCKGGSGTLIARDSFVNGKLWALRIDPFLGGDLCLTYGGIFTGTTIATTGHNLADGAIHMAGFSYDGSTLELYIDGVLAQTASVSFSTIGTNVDMTFGAARSGSGDSFVDLYTGILDEGRIFDQRLSASDHAYLWTEATT